MGVSLMNQLHARKGRRIRNFKPLRSSTIITSDITPYEARLARS